MAILIDLRVIFRAAYVYNISTFQLLLGQGRMQSLAFKYFPPVQIFFDACAIFTAHSFSVRPCLAEGASPNYNGGHHFVVACGPCFHAAICETVCAPNMLAQPGFSVSPHKPKAYSASPAHSVCLTLRGGLRV